ncbi:MAG TPA: FliH/SctL family protein [Alphaproteobacteria bacterium]|nr:FliH/SctL family protein [Alphaproteobacteria bacterium]
MVRNIRKFTFDSFVDFDRLPEPTEEHPEAEAQPVYSQAEIDQARADAFEEGRTKALVDYENTDAHRLTSAVERLADGMARLGAAEETRSREFHASAMNVAIAAIRKIMPELARRFGQQEIEAVIATALTDQHDEPRLVFRVPDPLFEPAAERIAELARQRGYAGKTVILADSTLGPSECRIEWADGGVERLTDRTLADIAHAIARLVQTPPNPAISPIEQ